MKLELEEFLTANQSNETEEPVDGDFEGDAGGEEVVSNETLESIEVQKAVVESLAAEKVEQDELIKSLKERNKELEEAKKALEEKCNVLEEKNREAEEKNRVLEEKNNALEEEIRANREQVEQIEKLKKKIAEQNDVLSKVGDVLSKNSESPLSNKVSLLDRDEEIPDRFLGETREHVLEVLVEARNQAEADGHIRRAQILEGVLSANAPEGILAEKRAALEKFFADNGNILSGPVIEELVKQGISHKNGEEYLLPSEIIKRTY